MQGQSYITEEKIRGFCSFYEQQLAVFAVSQKLSSQTYVAIDLHAGCGINSELAEPIIGSPLLFAELSKRHYRNSLLFAVEKNRERAKQLGDYLASHENAFVFAGDNSELCMCIPDILRSHKIEPANAFGSILLDPNGFVDQLPWKELSVLTSTCSRMDVAFNYPGTAFKRNRNHPGFVHINELPLRCNKSHWYVRKPLPTHHFTLCLGRNTSKIKPATGGQNPFVPWGSADGERFRYKAMGEVIPGQQFAFAFARD